MRLTRDRDGFQINATDLGWLLNVPPEQVQRLMRENKITSMCETGVGPDTDRHRVTFRHGLALVQLTIDESGEVLSHEWAIADSERKAHR
ncbi:hypothetical protein MXMO3_03534 (plasmid) [Maritalea myrionectae]|uniref:Uncharacterized protein n=1 Tax=Maritalea myrionectae TaxID=454601 RepID=A0A2R4MJ82_9HYPH|nr:hypothetical protein MXMO3_03534 [Maritalea myrionectae]